MAQCITIEVSCGPPAKDSAKSVMSKDHDHYPRVQALEEAMLEAMQGRTPFEKVPVKMCMTYHRSKGSKADALNMANGVADVIQKRGNESRDCWVIDDDQNIREFHYSETQARSDWYTLTVTPLEAR